MIFEILISTFGSFALISIAAWLSKTWIKERLTASLRIETEKEISSFKSDLENTNQRLRDLVSIGSAANSQVENALLEHKIAAVKKIWESVISWREMNVVTMIIPAISESWVEENGAHPDTTKNFKQILDQANYIEFMKTQCETENIRPFVSENIWALYSAHSSLLSSRLMKASILSISGIDHKAIFQRVNERKLIENSSPEEILARYDSDVINGTQAYIDYIKDSLLKEFKYFLSGEYAGSRAVIDASRILQSSEELMKSASINRS